MVDTCCGRLHFQKRPHHFLSHFTHLSHNATLTHPQLELGSVCLCNGVCRQNAVKSSLCGFWGLVTDANKASGILSFSLSFRRDPSLWDTATMLWGSPGHTGETMYRYSTWQPHMGPPVTVRHVSEEAFRFQLPVLGSSSRGPTSQGADMSSPLYPGWIPYPQKPWEKIHNYRCFRALSFGVNCYATRDYRYYGDIQILQRESLHDKSYLYSLVSAEYERFSKLIKTEGIVLTGSCEKGKKELLLKGDGASVRGLKIVVSVAQHCGCNQCHWIIHLKWLRWQTL